MRLFLTCTVFLLAFLPHLTAAPGPEDNKDIFDLTRYSQNLDDFLSPRDPGWETPLLDPHVQEARTRELLEHLCGSLSPWDEGRVQSLLNQAAPDDVKSWEELLLRTYGNRDKLPAKIGYGSNYRPYPVEWADSLAARMDLAQLDTRRRFDPRNRAIAVNNLPCRLLPTDDVHFYHYTIAGEGYPFDNLQNSVVWAGIPVYILARSQEGAWSLVYTPDFIGWVKSDGLARVDEKFIWVWRRSLLRGLVAVVRPGTPLRTPAGEVILTAFNGSSFPCLRASQDSGQDWEVLVPTREEAGPASFARARVPSELAAKIPLAATPRNFSRIMKGMLGRPYGWGNMYFYNDCSAELKALFLPFGIYLPRNSAAQPGAGRQTDLSACSLAERLDFLVREGRPLTTVFFIGGHVILYIGNVEMDGTDYPMSYQSIWGLAPPDRSRRSIIGGSVLLPILDVYPEDPVLLSLAAKPYFIVSFLDGAPQAKTARLAQDIRSLILPERELDDGLLSGTDRPPISFLPGREPAK